MRWLFYILGAFGLALGAHGANIVDAFTPFGAATETYPVQESSTTGNTGSTTTKTYTISYPTGSTAGDLMLLLHSNDGAKTYSSNDGGFTLLDTLDDSDNEYHLMYKIFTTGTSFGVTLSQPARHGHVLLRISGAGSAAPGYTELVTAASGEDPDPPSHTETSSKKYLWVALAAFNHGQATFETAPTNYSDRVWSGLAAGTTNEPNVVTASRQLEASTENPGVFTQGTAYSSTYGAWTVAVSP